MTDTQTDEPFDPDVPKRITAYLDIADRILPQDADVALIWDSSSQMVHLTKADLRQLLARDAYAEKTRLQLAETSATWRARYEQTRANLEALRGWTRSRLKILDRMQPPTSDDAAKISILNDLARVLDHLDTIEVEDAPQ